MFDTRSRFEHEALTDIVGVGAVGPSAARIWVRSEKPGTIQVDWWNADDPAVCGSERMVIEPGNPSDNTGVVDIRSHSEDEPLLTPLTRYRFIAVRSDDQKRLGEGSFVTAPAGPDDTPERFAFALMSCNQPFDKDGAVTQEARQMLTAIGKTLVQHDARFVYMVGDQIYSDYPTGLSLFNDDYFREVTGTDSPSILDCPAEEIRRLYHERYRLFWNLPGWRDIFSNYPCYMVLDDHDIVDNWGSDPDHENAEWQRVREGAVRAYFDYQASRVLPVTSDIPQDFHYSVTYGHSAFFIMDLRTSRRAGGEAQLYFQEQVDDLEAFFQRNADRKVLFLAISVPVIHVPRKVARIGALLPAWGEDFSDRWSSPAHVRDRDRLLKLIEAHQRAHPEQEIVILSGDIHIGCVHRIQWQPDGPDLFQIISSGVTHGTPRMVQAASKALIRLQASVRTRDGSCEAKVRLLPGEGKPRKNPYGGLNMGIVEVQTPKPHGRPQVRFLLYGHEGDEPVCVYRSPWTGHGTPHN